MRLPPHVRSTKRDSTVFVVALLVGIAGLFMGGCPDKKPKGPNCHEDKDCPTGEKCVDQRCRGCADDSQCEAYEHCDNGACALDPGKCRTNADCPDGGVCKDHACTPCTADAECGADKRCQDGRCLARGACKRDEDCADDEDCVDGVCKRGGGAATSAAPGCALDPIFFAFDGAAIDETAKATIDKDAECVKSLADRALLVSGHTDPRGTEEYNVALSEKRGQAVGDYLARLGIDPARFHYVPKGETEATGTDEAGWQQDRRVELEWQ